MTGTVINPQNEPLEFVSVALLHPKDSTMINFTTTDVKGFFEITENSKDTLLVQLFSTGYKAHFQQVVKSKDPVNFKTIILEENIDL
ncbi:carboxypeptidase-like regulatory domain-containing protein, partial [Bacteroidota bacterium]